MDRPQSEPDEASAPVPEAGTDPVVQTPEPKTASQPEPTSEPETVSPPEPVALGETRTEHEFLDLLKDAKIGKRKHFHAAQRKQQWHTRFGIAALMLTSMASIVSALRDYVPETLVGMIGTALPAIAAILVGLQTFLRLEKMVEGHRAIANEYLRLHRDGKALFARRLDGRMSIEELETSFDRYRVSYHKLNKDSEAFATNPSDLGTTR